MEEKNTTNPNEKNESQPVNENKPAAASAPKKAAAATKKEKGKESFSDKAKDYKAEFKKIVWPNRQEVLKKTVTVIVTSLLMGVIIFCMDTVYTTGYNLILSLLG